MCTKAMLLNQWNLEIFLDVAKAFQKYKWGNDNYD
jgi:hypothetical protein